MGNYRKPRLLAVFLTLALLALSFAVIDGQILPQVIVPEDTYVSGGDTTNITVTLTNAPTQDQVVAVTSSDSSTFAVPSSVTVPAGHTTATFTGYASATNSEETPVLVTSSCNGGSASAVIVVD